MIYIYIYIYLYKWHACPGSYTGYYEHIFTFVYVYTYCLLPVVYCLKLQSHAACPDWGAQGVEAHAARLAETDELEVGFMRHGHEMLWFSWGFFSESELSPSYNAKLQNARAHSINWLRDQHFEQGMIIYIYIYIYIYNSLLP